VKDDVIHLFNSYPQYALLLSIIISVIVAILGVIPSVFVTAANVLFFGFWQGTIVSFAGESIGAFIAFKLYRAGFKKWVESQVQKISALNKLLQAQGKEAFFAIVSLRLLPFVPSGVVTFTAAMGRVSSVTFLIASSLGKIPALLIEAYAAYHIVEFGWQGKAILGLVAIYLLYLVFRKKK
jgi:uncharacterized membrane protein YdjX (TVP38/TMEM64 family)